jgi:hypothetical protein
LIVIGAAAVPVEVAANGLYVPRATITVSPGLVAAFTADWIEQYGVVALSVVEFEQTAPMLT